jgi:hypothetical protein
MHYEMNEVKQILSAAIKRAFTQKSEKFISRYYFGARMLEKILHKVAQ